MNNEIKCVVFFFFQAEDGIRDLTVTGVQTCALPILGRWRSATGSSTRLATVKRRIVTSAALSPSITDRRETTACTPQISAQRRPRPKIGRASCRERV